MNEVTVTALTGPRPCKARNRQGNPCGNYAAIGQLVCHMHGARSPQALRAAKRRLAHLETVEEVERLGGHRIEVSPDEALTALIAEAAGNVAMLRALLSHLRQGTGRYGSEALISPDHLGDLAVHPLVDLYNAERDRLARYSKLAGDAGIAERRQAVHEEQATFIAGVLRATLDAVFGLLRAAASQGALDVQRVVDIEAKELPGIVRGVLVGGGESS